MISRKQPLFFRNANRGVERMTRSSKSRSKKRRTLLDRLRRQTATKKRSNLMPGMERLEDRRMLACYITSDKTELVYENATRSIAGHELSDEQCITATADNITINFEGASEPLKFEVNENRVSIEVVVGTGEILKLGAIEIEAGRL
uniref:hypothetical protein n=1 Tax=Stieleria sp. TaxID=2795976 RepID=UPI003566C12D